MFGFPVSWRSFGPKLSEYQLVAKAICLYCNQCRQSRNGALWLLLDIRSIYKKAAVRPLVKAGHFFDEVSKGATLAWGTTVVEPPLEVPASFESSVGCVSDYSHLDPILCSTSALVALSPQADPCSDGK